jgi:opacity protein-like surface antigen
MKTTILATIVAFAASATTVFAGNLSDPVIEAPVYVAAEQAWTGVYGGLSYGQTKNNDVIVLSTRDTTEEFGAFAGYRYDMGTFVGGVEAGTNNGLDSIEGQVGLDLGAATAYGHVGYGRFNDVDDTTYGVGADLAVTDNVIVGLKYTAGDFNGADLEQITARVGFKF